jgi:acetyl esterase/lipase
VPETPPTTTVFRDEQVDAAVRVRVYSPPDPGSLRPCVYWIHGGGYITGSALTVDARLNRWVETLGCVVVAVEYRLAPEHPFPAPLDDCETAARWAASQDFGGPLYLGGQSAGANLSLAVALRCRDLAIAGLNLLYGAYDLTLTPSAANYGATGTLTTPALEMFYGCYEADASARRNPEISPLYADLRGLPPVLITVGTADPLLDDSLFLHARLLAAGGESELHVHPGGMHMFDTFPLPIAESANATIASFLTRARVPVA